MTPQNPPTSRERLLAAGRELLGDPDVDLLANGLVMESVAARAGLSTQTFYNIYPVRRGSGVAGGKAAFIDDLLSSLLTAPDADLQQRIDDEVAEQAEEGHGDPRRIIRAICRWDFERVRDALETQLRFVVCAAAVDHEKAATAVREHYRDMVRIANETNAGILRLWSADLRQPFTLDSLAVVLSALVDGLVLRSRVDPDAVSAELFGDAVAALLGSILDVNQTHEHVDDMLAPLAEAAIKNYQLAHPTELPDDPEQAIIDAASVEFGQRGYFATERAHIADRAGVDLETLRDLFPSNVDMVVAGLRPTYETLRRRIANDVRIRRNTLDIVSRYGARLAELIRDKRAFFDAMALLISLHTAQAPVNATRIRDELFFPALIVDVMAQGQEGGVFIADIPATELAAIYTNNILLRCLSRRDEQPGAAAAVIDRLFLHGLLTRSDPI